MNLYFPVRLWYCILLLYCAGRLYNAGFIRAKKVRSVSLLSILKWSCVLVAYVLYREKNDKPLDIERVMMANVLHSHHDFSEFDEIYYA